MSDRPSWFRCDASRLLGALAGMEPDCGYLYTVVLMRIYEVGGPIGDDAGILSRRTGYTTRRVETALAWLIDHGKIERLADGRLDSDTTHAEIADREKFILNARNAGKSSAKLRQTFKPQKTQQKQQTGATLVEPALNGSATGVERPFNHIQEHIEVASATSKRAVALTKSNPIFDVFVSGGLSPETAQGVIDHRRAIKHPLTVLGAQGLLKGFQSTADPEDAARTMAARGWRGFKLSWYEDHKANERNGKLTVQAAARNNIERGITFGPVPSPYLPGRNGEPPSGDSPGMLSEGRRGGSGDLRGGGSFDPDLLPLPGGLSGD